MELIVGRDVCEEPQLRRESGDISYFFGQEGLKDVKGVEGASLATFTERPENVALAVSDGSTTRGMILFDKGYQAHIAFMPDWRGEFALKASRKAVKYVFTRTPVTYITAYIHRDNKSARMIADKVGLVKMHADERYTQHYYLDLQKWFFNNMSDRGSLNRSIATVVAEMLDGEQVQKAANMCFQLKALTGG